jgi:alkylhydroperoxidase/carboxymuconolactone decarboxylase family protein YurZ
MPEHPLKVFERIDPEMLRHVEASRAFAFEGNALQKKFKYLLIMALDAAHGAPQGVAANARAAIEAGATKEEIAEALRITHFVSGTGSVYVSAHALENMF